MNQPLLEVKDISLSFKGVKAIQMFPFKSKKENSFQLLDPMAQGKLPYSTALAKFTDHKKVIFAGKETVSVVSDLTQLQVLVSHELSKT
tara:strand:+ start:175 stop:441 length:267 start_codon:yes stop_codon:yes gene_type:complete